MSAAAAALVFAAAADVCAATPPHTPAPKSHASASSASFTFADIEQRARALAAAAYQAAGETGGALRDLDESHYRAIRFRAAATFWRNAGEPFRLQFFHTGWHFTQPIKVNEITASAVQPLAFDSKYFDYSGSGVDAMHLDGAAFAGLRILAPLNAAGKDDEVLSFLGASYFRALGKQQSYGLSARALAVDTGLASGEEFPRFVEFWIERPKAAAKSLMLFALLDSPRISGAYEFVLTPGNETTVRVRAHLFPREKVGKLGIAPLTSMFFFGANQRAARDDYRPQVHDSDGLSIHTASGEWLWRPLVNPKRLLVTSFALTDPLGFGLMQRTRDFHQYEDLATHYQTHPSVWVEPLSKWGAGHVELVEIPSPDDSNDNISAFWISDQPATEFSYALHWQKNTETRPNAWIAQTRRGDSLRTPADGSTGFVIDWQGPQFGPSDTVTTELSGDANSTIVAHELQPNPVDNGWRLAVRVKRNDEKKSAELRASLQHGAATSEIWSYVLPPE